MKGFLSYLIIGVELLSLTSVFPGEASAGGNLSPTASLVVTPRRGSINTEFLFDASSSRDSLGRRSPLEFRFTANYPNIPFTNWQNSSRMKFKYSADGIGEKRIVVEIRDEFGLTDKAATTVLVMETQHVLGGYFEVNPLEGSLDSDFTFIAFIQQPEDPLSSRYKIRWDFDGDGTFDTDFSPERTVRHYYARVGVYRPEAEMLSPEGTIISLLHIVQGQEERPNVSVSDPEYPIARLQVSPTKGTASMTQFTFDGSESWGKNDGKKLLYRFDFGNGVFTEFSDSPRLTHVFETPGKYTIILEVQDSKGKEDQTAVVVEVIDQQHKPEISFSIFQQSGVLSGTTGTIGTQYRFIAKVRDLDEGAMNTRVRWDFDGDFVFDTPFARTKTAFHTYFEPGAKRVTVEAVDSTNRTRRATQDFLVIENTAPSVSLNVQPRIGTPGDTFEIIVSSLNDNQNRPSRVQIRYDFDGDGVFDTKFTHQKKVRHNFETIGTKKIVVQVRDQQGLLAEDSATVKVIASTPPNADITTEPKELVGVFSTRFAFTGKESSDRETQGKDLKYRWDLNYQGENDIVYDTNFSPYSTRILSFNEIGERKIKLDVRDKDGMIRSKVATIRIHWASPYIETLRKKRVMKGYTNPGDMKPDQAITRAEFLKMMLLSNGVRVSGQLYRGAFSDVGRKDWFWQVVEKARDLGYAQGYPDGTFHPNEHITRAEAASLLAKAYNLSYSPESKSQFSDVDSSDWFFDPVHATHKQGLFQGFPGGTFRPWQKLTRGEAAKIIVLAGSQPTLAKK